MEVKKISDTQEEYLNTNETIHDYSFFYQIIFEERTMDFEAMK